MTSLIPARPTNRGRKYWSPTAVRAWSRSLPAGVASAAALLAAGCTDQSPSSVCAAPETLDTVRAILIGPPDMVGRDLMERAFDEIAEIGVIRFDSQDPQSRVISCRAQVTNRLDGDSFEISYTREPTVDGGYYYRVNYDRVQQWNVLGMSLVSRASSYAQPTTSSHQDATSDQHSASQDFDDAEVPRSAGSDPRIIGPFPEPAAPAPQPAAPAPASQIAPIEAPAAQRRPEQRVEYAGPPPLPTRPGDPPSADDQGQPRQQTVTNPMWARAPRTALPQAAIYNGYDRGEVQLDCQAWANGRLHQCKVLSESARNIDLGVTALEAARSAVLSPRQIDRMAADAHVIFTVRMQR